MSLTLATTSLETSKLDKAARLDPAKRCRDWTTLRLGAALLAVVAMCTFATLQLVETEIVHARLIDSTNAEIAMQRATDSLADKTRSLFGSLDGLVRLAGLVVRLDECCEPEARREAREAMQAAMRQSPLGLHALELRGPAGTALLALGDEPQGAPRESASQPGPGLPWATRTGRHVLHVVRLLPANPGYTLRVTVDLDVLADAAEVAAAPGTRTSLYRLSDGAVLTPLTHGEVEQLAGPPAPIRFADPETLDRFERNDRGRLAEDQDDQEGVQLVFVTLHELGLVVATKEPHERLLAVSTMHAHTLRLVPVFVLLIGLVATGAVLIVATRRRARADLNEEHRVFTAEAAARAELEQLVRCSPAMLYRGRVSPSGDYKREFLTPNTREVTGWEPETLSDKDQLWALAPSEDRLLRDNNYRRAVREGRSAVEYRFQRPDGGYSWLRNEAVVIRRLPDGSTEVAGAITNISREREIAAYAAMQNRLASLGEIAASLAHELTQPMTVIGIAAAIAQGVASELPGAAELRRQLDAIASQSERASDIIRHLRLYGRADGGPMADVRLRQAAQGALSLVGMALREADVEVVVDIPEDLPPVRARLVQVEQVLVNLLINARDAMGANPSTARRITLRGSKIPGGVRLEVEDTGPGVPACLIERLFEPFYTTKAPGEGTGLGLSLCQTMMRQFGGTITATNGRYGAIFALEFPIRADAPNPVPPIPVEG
jgi:signal transduction histidine kinase